jgi:GNAT superfamily N-acetyltransferase
MQESDLQEAARVVRVAFGTFLGAPDPENFFVDRDYAFTRWHADPTAAVVAELEGKVVGSNFATNWGSFAFFGPLTVLPEFWERKIAQKLLGPTMALFEKWGVREAGLFTFPQSPKHVGLYQKFGFWPRYLTAVMSKSAERRGEEMAKFSTLGEEDQKAVLKACRELTDAIYEGLDVSIEIRSVQAQRLGETLLAWSGSWLDGFAVCHCGERTEAGRENCYIKFAAVRPGPKAERIFEALLGGCETLAIERGLRRIDAGVNFGRGKAYRQMLSRGFRTSVQGVAMHRPDSPAFSYEGAFVIDDWR